MIALKQRDTCRSQYRKFEFAFDALSQDDDIQRAGNLNETRNDHLFRVAKVRLPTHSAEPGGGAEKANCK